MCLTEPNNPRITGHQRTTLINGGRDQQSIRRVAVLETVQPVGARCGAVAQRQDLYAGPIGKALKPGFDWTHQFNPAPVNKLRDFPDADRAEQNGTAAAPAILDQPKCSRAQSFIARFQP
jgi:hypothetical protein